MKKNTIGVVIGRFETSELHPGHFEVLNAAHSENDVFCIILGTHDGVPTTKYPLDVPTRTVMLQSAFPTAMILSIKDAIVPTIWSKNLDTMLKKQFGSIETITLYGSRDSFLEKYTGACKVKFILEVESVSASEIRARDCTTPIDSVDFRKGAIYSTMTRFPIVFAAIDIVPYRIQNNEIEVLVGERYSEGSMIRFIGGISDVKDNSFDETAARELSEEILQIKVEEPQYVCSCKIDDHRYRGTRDGVMTTVFLSKYISGEALPSDDIDIVHWVPLAKLEERLVPTHKVLFPKIEKKLLSL